MSKTFKLSPRVVLDLNEHNKEFVPESMPFENHKGLLEHVATAINQNLPVLLLGETGTGKTSLVRYLASKTNNGFRRVNHNGATSVDDIVGKILVNKEGTYWVDGVLIEAMRKGWWYLADEINASSAEINFVYHSLLDDDAYIVLAENNGEIVRPHPSFRFFASMNPSADYAGVKELNKALLGRFIVVKTDFSPPAIESKILQSRTGIVKDVADRMIKFAAEIRANYAKQKVAYVLSTRDLLMWATMFQQYKKYMVSGEVTVLNKVGNDDFESVKDLMALHFKSLDEPKVKAAAKKTVNEKVEDLASAFGTANATP
jgi:midasin